MDQNQNTIQDALDTISNLESLIESTRDDQVVGEFSDKSDDEANQISYSNEQSNPSGLTNAMNIKSDLVGQIKNLRESLHVKDEIIVDYDRYFQEVTKKEKLRSSIARSVVE